MNKTKKTAVFVLLTIFLACSLIGCTKPACETTTLLGKTVWIIMLTNIISQGKPVYHIKEAICTKYSVGMYGEVTISTVTKDERKTRNETPLTAIGDTVFLSKEDAEIKLKEMRR